MGKEIKDYITENWAEILMLALLLLGFMISVLLQNQLFSYFSGFLAGFISGYIYAEKRYEEPILPFVLIFTGLLLGFLLGGIWVSRLWLFIFFAFGFLLSYYLHLKKIIGSFKSEKFIK